mgnify:CR=1 FL=1
MKRLTNKIYNNLIKCQDCIEESNCYEQSCGHIEDAICRLKEYEDLEDQGLLLELPCRMGDSIFIVGKCKDFPDRLDGGYWDATGYYCPYEDSELCPFSDYEDCNSVKDKLGVFEDTFIGMSIEEDNIYLIFENGVRKYLSDFGNTVFITREDAEKKLNDIR